MSSSIGIRHLRKRGNREQGTGKREQQERIDNFWMRIDLILNFHQMSILKG